MRDVVHDAAGVKIIRAHPGAVGPLLLFGSSDGQVLLVSYSMEGLVRWDVTTGRPLFCYWDDLGPINGLAAVELPDGRPVPAAAREDGFNGWEARTGEPPAEPEELTTVWAVAAGPLPGGRAVRRRGQ